MVIMPAICDNCGAIFSSGFRFENSINISLKGCISGPCPRCGSSGHIPEGVYNFINNTIELLAGSDITVEELQKLAKILEESRNSNLAPQMTTEAIKKEVPRLSNLAILLPQNRSEYIAYIGLVLAALGVIVPLIASGNKLQIENKTEINTVINQIVNQACQQNDQK